jgi:hypothetical protein
VTTSRTPVSPNLRPFKPGQSGNPGGRAKGLSALVRQRTKDGVLLYDALITLVNDARDERTRFEALKLLAAYGYGTPGQAQVEWDEQRVRAAAVELGKDPNQMVSNWRLLRGERLGA